MLRNAHRPGGSRLRHTTGPVRTSSGMRPDRQGAAERVTIRPPGRGRIVKQGMEALEHSPTPAPGDRHASKPRPAPEVRTRGLRHDAGAPARQAPADKRSPALWIVPAGLPPRREQAAG
jgi:hypothetical protein